MTEAAVIEAAFRSSGLGPGDFTYQPKPGPPTPLRSFLSSDAILTIGVDAEGRRLNLVERTCRTWAGAHDIPVPRILDASDDGGWLLARRVHTRPAEGTAFVHAALDVADRIAALPAPDLDIPASQWRASRVTLPIRLVRSTVGGLNPAAFVQARRAAGSLTERTTSHGDYYRRNVLADIGGGVSVVDWEFVGPAPRWTDHVRLWSTLRRPEDRRTAWTRITSQCTGSGAEQLAVLVRWLTLRLLAENLAAPRSQRDSADLSHARVVVSEARTLSAALR